MSSERHDSEDCGPWPLWQAPQTPCVYLLGTPILLSKRSELVDAEAVREGERAAQTGTSVTSLGFSC